MAARPAEVALLNERLMATPRGRHHPWGPLLLLGELGPGTAARLTYGHPAPPGRCHRGRGPNSCRAGFRARRRARECIEGVSGALGGASQAWLLAVPQPRHAVCFSAD